MPPEERFKFSNEFWICHNCHRELQKSKMPQTCHANGLYNSKIPKIFEDLSYIENMMIKMILPFVKVRQLWPTKMLAQYAKIANIPISDNDILNTNIRLPRMADDLGTINVTLKRDFKYGAFRHPEVIRPNIVNKALKELQKRHKYYTFFKGLQFLDNDSKYAYIRLPLIGGGKVDENALSLSAAYEKLVPPLLDELNLQLGEIVHPDHNSFLHSLLDQFKYDREYLDSNLSIENMRECVSASVFLEENVDLHPILNFENNEPLSAEQWKDLMSISKDGLHCDLPFVQMTANWLNRNISLIPIYQPCYKPEDNSKNDEKQEENEKKITTVYANVNTKKTFFMLYFIGFPKNYFQSVVPNSQEKFKIPPNYCQETLNSTSMLNIEPEIEESKEENEENSNLYSINNTSPELNSQSQSSIKNPFNLVTMLTPLDPAASVVVNESDEVILKKFHRGQPMYEIAPGKGKIPHVWVRNKDDDVKMFPNLFVDGKFGLNHEPREKNISPARFYAQRILNENPMYAKDPDYVFVSQRHSEMHALENQINMSMSHGSLEVKDNDGTTLVPSQDHFHIFQSIPGTPAYFKKFRTELCARMEQLGPFHFFFTLSCAETRWPSVILEVLQSVHNYELKVTYAQKEWDGSFETIMIDDGEYYIENELGEPTTPSLDIYLKHYLSKEKKGMTDFLKDHYIIITRVFDKRVKDFLNTVMKDMGIENYCYRVEFQMRGLPHIHGVFWLKKEYIETCLDRDGLFRTDEEGEKNIIAKIDEWIFCSRKFGDPKLEKIVNEVQKHNCTKTCYKYCPSKCRFDFPRPPSQKTMIAKPIEDLYPNESEEYRRQKLDHAVYVMTKVQDALKSLKEDEDDSIYDNNLEMFLKEKCNAICSIDEYQELLQLSVSGRAVILKRNVSERRINNYNPTILSAWNANTDIQLCLDSYAVVTYITDYLTKADTGLTQALKRALKEKKDCEYKDQINHIKKVYFDNIEICVSAAAYRLIPGKFSL